MRRGDDSPAEAAGLLRPQVWLVGLRIQQALPDDGETAQPRSGGGRHCLGEPDWRTRHGVYVPREGRGKGCHHRDILEGDERDGGRTPDGPPALFHHRQKRPAIRAPIPAAQQLEGQKPVPMRQLQYDQHRRGLPTPHRPGPVAAYLWRLIPHPRAYGSPPRPRGRAALRGSQEDGTRGNRHHTPYRRPRGDGQRPSHHDEPLRRRLCDVRPHRQRRDVLRARPLGHPAGLLLP